MNNISWFVFVVLLGLNFLWAVVRSSLVNARFTHLMSLRDSKPQAVDKTLKLLERSNLRVTLRTLVLLSHAFLGAFGAYIAITYLRDVVLPETLLWAVLGITLVFGLVLLLLEFWLESYILQNAERWAMRFTSLTSILDWLLRPLSALLFGIHGVPVRPERGMGSVTEDEIKTWVQVGEPDGGSLEKGERQMIYSIFQFGDTICREVMVPRIDLLAIDVSTSISEANTTIIQSGHSRLPVYDDNIDNIIGLLYAKDLLRVMHDGGEVPSLRSLLRTAYFVPESKKVDDLLHEMQARRVHMAIVVDEYGGTSGMVTLEDIMEEIVGEIQDEYDQSEEAPYQQVGPEEFLFHGRLGLDDVNDLLHIQLTKDLGDTLGGYIYGHLGRVPVPGDKLELEDWVITIEMVAGRRIRRVRARRLSREQDPQEEINNHVEPGN